MNSKLVALYKMNGRDYSLRIEPNPGSDPEYPASQYPCILFSRDLLNPLASAWAFEKSEAEARATADKILDCAD